jgi:glucose/arabinose dehydrogenase
LKTHLKWPPLLLALYTISINVNAFPRILDDWIEVYPSSVSGEVDCGLCHQKTVGGGSPWNEYGHAIREALDGSGLLPSEAIELVQFDHVGGDNNNVTFLDEINAGFQAGWTVGATNILYSGDVNNPTEDMGNTAPGAIAQSALDFPDEVTDPNNIVTQDIGNTATTLVLQEIATGFNAPVRAVRAPGIDGSLFVIEQTGKILRVDLETGQATEFHDVSNDLVNPLGAFGNYDERGLLGLAFHPDYQNNGLFYTYQSEPVRSSEDSTVDFVVASNDQLRHRSMVVEYRASDASCNSFIRKTKNLMVLDQPQFNHNGGDMVFDIDGLLYISLGDGGASNDSGQGHGPLGNGRDKTTVLGSILRIDPLGSTALNGKYGIPIDNPFLDPDDEGLDEIFAYGLRNPYRMSIDAQTGDLYTGDVGQGALEEVNIVIKGGNYGWNIKEGEVFFYNPEETPSNATQSPYVSLVGPPVLPSDLVEPIAQYDRGEGISVIGGYVYRGSTLDAMQGFYIFGDYLGRLFKLDQNTGVIQEFLLQNENMDSVDFDGLLYGFGQDADNELYAVTNATSSVISREGKLLKLVEAGDEITFPSAEGESAMCPPDESICIPIKTTNDKIATICL